MLKTKATSTTTTVTTSSAVTSGVTSQLKVPISEVSVAEARKSQQEVVKGKRTKTSHYKLQSEFQWC